MRLEVMSTRTRQKKHIAQTVIHHLPSLPFQYFKNLASAPFTGPTAIHAGFEREKLVNACELEYITCKVKEFTNPKVVMLCEQVYKSLIYYF